VLPFSRFLTPLRFSVKPVFIRDNPKELLELFYDFSIEPVVFLLENISILDLFLNLTFTPFC
jgi:hypothetical protein